MEQRHRESLEDIYKGADRFAVAAAGRRFLDGNLAQRLGASRRLLLMAGILLGAVLVFAGIIAIAYMIEKTTSSAGQLGDRRQREIEHAGQNEE